VLPLYLLFEESELRLGMKHGSKPKPPSVKVLAILPSTIPSIGFRIFPFFIIPM